MIFAVHGFLGSANEWNALKNLTLQETWITPSLFESFQWPKTITFESVVRQLRETYYLPALNDNSKSAKKFMGYSLGGRIGLQWLELFPHDFDQWFFVSTHPGLATQSEKDSRHQSDLQWAAKLQQLDQSSFLKAWNNQAVFAGTSESLSAQLNCNKENLAVALINLSLSQQKDFSEILKQHQSKVHWVVGSSDQKFSNLAFKLKEGVKIQHLHSLLGGHRIYLDQPKPLAELLLNFSLVQVQ